MKGASPTSFDFDERTARTNDGRNINYFMHLSPQAAKRKQRQDNDSLDVHIDTSGRIKCDGLIKATLRKTPIAISNHLKDLVHKKKALEANHHNIFEKAVKPIIKKQITSPISE